MNRTKNHKIQCLNFAIYVWRLVEMLGFLRKKSTFTQSSSSQPQIFSLPAPIPQWPQGKFILFIVVNLYAGQQNLWYFYNSNAHYAYCRFEFYIFFISSLLCLFCMLTESSCQGHLSIFGNYMYLKIIFDWCK